LKIRTSAEPPRAGALENEVFKQVREAHHVREANAPARGGKAQL
jgi:hypothetical protein